MSGWPQILYVAKEGLVLGYPIPLPLPLTGGITIVLHAYPALFFFLKTWSYFIVQIGPELLGNPPASISKMPMLSSLQLITKLSSGPDPKLTCATSPCPSAVICCPRLVSEGKPLPV